ncbi:MAG: hypothetical protein K2R98_03280 [Gemmataceae bacterium]|nr:hypothetical protein [Gemmataceae bacterium]
MAKDGLRTLLCVCALIVPILSLARAAPGDERDNAVSNTLAVQTAMQQGREFLLRGDCKSAVHTLEAQLSKINGNAAYLALLRDAYRAHVKELRLANQEAEAQRYLQRLQILDPGAAMDGSVVRGANAPAQQVVPVATATPKTVAAPAAPAKPEVTTARGKTDADYDPFHPSREDKQKTARTFLARAEEEFKQRHYKEANSFFEQAHQADAATATASQERWAYCKLHRVVEALNQSPSPTALTELEKETQHALTMAPRLEYGKNLLAEIDKRREASKAPKDPPVTVKHMERGTDGWQRAETANFRIFHTQSKEVAEQAAQVAERTRLTMSRKWFGGFKDDWNPRCDLYLHATAQDYSKATGVPNNSPGHSSIRSDGGRVLSRRIDLHCDDVNNMLVAVLPHEATHVVLAGQFGEHQIPRWADEGMAVLTEPREKVNGHLKNLGRCRQESQLFNVKQLMQLADYPEPRYITAFYAQSVSLVDYLANEKGPQAFTEFLREALKDGYEASLKKHYGYRNFDDLHQKWSQKALAGADNTSGNGVAQNR